MLFSSFDDRHIDDESNNDWDKMGLNGRVKSVTEEQCRIRVKSGENRICNVKLKTTFDSDGHIIEEQTWEFSQLIEKKTFTYNKTVLEKIESFDQKNSLVATYLFVYDQRGYKVEETIFSESSVPDSRYTYLYDANGRKTQMDGYNLKTGKHFIKEIFKYDNFGNRVKETSEHASGNSSTELSYKYSKEKRIIEKAVKTTYEKLGTYSTTIRYKYDSQNNLVEEHEIHNGRKRTTVIGIDIKGNWVKRTKTESKDTFLIVERTLEYF